MPSSNDSAPTTELAAACHALISDERLAATELSTKEHQRIARHLVLPGFSEEIQRRLAAARICVIGAGGLGSPALLALAAAGIGHITLCDDDTVDFSNLQRQVLYGQGAVGTYKADAATDRLTDMAPDLTIAKHGRFTADNAVQLCRDHDVVIDGSDNFATRYVAADAAEITGTPLVWGAVLRYAGQVAVFWHPHGPGLRDIFPQQPAADSIPSCAEAGVLGATTGVIGNLLATETIKLITGIGQPLVGQLLSYDALTQQMRSFRVVADPQRPRVTSMEQEKRMKELNAPDAVEYARQENHALLDVREPDERERGKIDLGKPEADLHIPLGTVKAQGFDAVAAQLPEGTDGVVVYCAGGVRSAMAIDAISDAADAAGVELVNLAGGYGAAQHVQ